MLKQEEHAGRGLLPLENALDDPLERAVGAENARHGGAREARVRISERRGGASRLGRGWRSRLGRGRRCLGRACPGRLGRRSRARRVSRRPPDREDVSLDVFFADQETALDQRLGVYALGRHAPGRARMAPRELHQHLQAHLRQHFENLHRVDARLGRVEHLQLFRVEAADRRRHTREAHAHLAADPADRAPHVLHQEVQRQRARVERVPAREMRSVRAGILRRRPVVDVGHPARRAAGLTRPVPRQVVELHQVRRLLHDPTLVRRRRRERALRLVTLVLAPQLLCPLSRTRRGHRVVHAPHLQTFRALLAARRPAFRRQHGVRGRLRWRRLSFRHE